MSEPKSNDVVIESQPDEFTAYVNLCGVALTSDHEAILHFARREIDGQNNARGVAILYMGMPHLKRLISVLQQLVENYEKKSGLVAVSTITETLLKMSLDARREFLQGLPSEVRRTPGWPDDGDANCNVE